MIGLHQPKWNVIITKNYTYKKGTKRLILPRCMDHREAVWKKI